MSKAKKSLKIKIISIGNNEVGKSCIIKRYCEKRFVPKYLQTIGIDYGVTKMYVKEREVKINIFDMSGHPVFHEVRNEFYKDTQGAMLVFDVTEKHTFDSLDNWLAEVKQDLEMVNSTNSFENIVFAVCANKIDKGKRVVDESDGRLWAHLRGFHYFETSASSGLGINEMFETLVSEICTTFENGGKPVTLLADLNPNKEQLDAINRLRTAKDNYERLGVKSGCSKEEVNNAYKRLAKLLHPDKNNYPGSGDAFKILVAAKTELLKIIP